MSMLATLADQAPVDDRVAGERLDESFELSSAQEDTVKDKADVWSSWKTIPTGFKAVYLEKIAASRTFARSAQLRRLLQFLGERTLSDDAGPTEYDVAFQVLNRGPEFDPRSDSVVRKEMSRLRAKLADYYAGEGSRDLIVVQSSAAYRLEFAWRTGTAVSAADDPRRCLLVLPATASEDDRSLGDAFYDELMMQLGSEGGCRLVSRTSARWYSSQPSDVREMTRECGADSVLEIAIRRSRNEPVLLLWLVDGPTGHTRASLRITEASTPEELARKATKWLNELGELPDPGSVHSHE